MKKTLMRVFLLSFALYSCSDDKDNLDNNTNINPENTLVKKLTCNGNAINGDIDVESNTETKFSVEIDGVSEKDIAWILNDEVMQVGTFTFTLKGRSGELKIGVPKQNSASSTRAWENPERTWDLTTVANLQGPFKNGVFIMDDNKGSTTLNGYMAFIDKSLHLTEEFNILNHKNDIKEADEDFDYQLSKSQHDFHKFNNKIYISQQDMDGNTTIAIYDAQTLKHISTTGSVDNILNKITPLEGGNLFARSIHETSNTETMNYFWDASKKEWKVLTIKNNHNEEINDIDKAIDMEAFRGNTTIAFAYDSKLIVLNNKTADFVKEIDFGTGRKPLSIVKGKSTTPTIKVLVDAPKTADGFGNYTDPTHNIQKAKLVTLDYDFNIIAEVDIKEELEVNGNKTTKHTAFYPYIHPRTYDMQMYAAASTSKEEIYIPRYSDTGILSIYVLDYSGVMRNFSEITNEELGHHRIIKPMVVTKTNKLFVNIKNHGNTVIYIYDIEQKTKVNHMNINTLDEVKLFSVGTI